MFSGALERDHWHEMGNNTDWSKSVGVSWLAKNLLDFIY